MNFKKRVNGSWTDTPNYIYNTSTDTITTLPAVVYPNDTTATVGLKGNMSQTGTPTPENPIQPSECGERTGNLCSLTEGYSNLINNVRFTITNNLLNIKGTASGSGGRGNKLSPVFTLPAGTYYVSFSEQPPNFTAYVNKNSDNTVIGYTSVGSFTLAEDTEVYIGCNVVSGIEYDATIGIMLNLGSTALPYEPYGIKIPISSGGTTTPIYLGEVESTRRIKKLVLTGEESYSDYAYSNTNGVSVRDVLDTTYTRADGICNIYPVSTVSGSKNCLWIGSGSGAKHIYFVSILDNMGLQDAAAFKTWTQQQYAAGTPVTVWYVLETPTTSIVNEPLRKIGDYADTISNVAEIPTTAGEQTFDVDTTLKPSEVQITYHGWHRREPKEYSGGSWT